LVRRWLPLERTWVMHQSLRTDAPLSPALHTALMYEYAPNPG
jgi:hypothetical protein